MEQDKAKANWPGIEFIHRFSSDNRNAYYILE